MRQYDPLFWLALKKQTGIGEEKRDVTMDVLVSDRLNRSPRSNQN
jgi:hypothetical protein